MYDPPVPLTLIEIMFKLTCPFCTEFARVLPIAVTLGRFPEALKARPASVIIDPALDANAYRY